MDHAPGRAQALIFGFGAPLGAMVGTAIGAGDADRARQATWTGVILAGLVTEAIGLAAAAWPKTWLHLFGADPTMLATGALYLRLVGPFYGLFGIGLVLYFAAQGAGRVGWALTAGLLRVSAAAGGGWLALRFGAGQAGIFLALALGLAVMAMVNLAGLLVGGWLPRTHPLSAGAPARPAAAAAAAAESPQSP